jgi:cell shape-determining protein MreC
MAGKRIRARNKMRFGPISTGMLFILFMSGGMIFFFAPQNLTNKFQFSFARVFRWPLGVGRTISLSARTQPQFVDVVSRRRYNQLQNYLANITMELSQERQKVEKLSGLLNRRPFEGAVLMFADVIASSAEDFIINRGQDDGVQKGQFVAGDNSIIGTISDVSPRTAKVEPITKTTSNMAAEIGGLKTVIHGNGKNSAKIRLVPTKYKVKIGDNVYACKKPGFLDAPMILGTVSQCRRDGENPLLWDITVKPACDIERLNDVTIIIMNP